MAISLGRQAAIGPAWTDVRLTAADVGGRDNPNGSTGRINPLIRRRQSNRGDSAGYHRSDTPLNAMPLVRLISIENDATCLPCPLRSLRARGAPSMFARKRGMGPDPYPGWTLFAKRRRAQTTRMAVPVNGGGYESQSYLPLHLRTLALVSAGRRRRMAPGVMTLCPDG